MSLVNWGKVLFPHLAFKENATALVVDYMKNQRIIAQNGRRRKLVDKPFLYLEELHALSPLRIKENKVNQKLQKKVNEYLKELRYYEQCDIQFGEICKHPRCINAILELKNGTSVTFKCGRLLNENKL